MRPILALALTGLLAAALIAPLPALAQSPTAGPATTAESAQRTVTFTVENMTCALCPLTVKRAMSAVAGVRAVTVDLDSRTATVTFDPALTDADAIAAASRDAGYPAAPRG
ncbi:MAG: copper chaperone [Alphaproteobacteria bacterium]|nr:MAG: copper chaperone [Alphaproteobacteria bacterium]